MVTLNLENTAWDFKDCPPEVALLPLVCMEPHGPHLPIGTDGLIMSAIARGVAERMSRSTYLLPVWPLGTSGAHLGQPGCVSLEYQTLWAVVRDVALSLHAHQIRHVVVLNNHGSPLTTTTRPQGNAVVKTAVRQLNYETQGLSAIWVQPFAAARAAFFEIFAAAESDLHAGEIETSLMLHLAPDLVRAGAPDSVPASPPGYLDAIPFQRLSPAGVWGRASLASAKKGGVAFAAAVGATVDYIEQTFAALHGETQTRSVG